MEHVGIRELRQHASPYVERLKAGEVVVVTEGCTLVALLVPPGETRTFRDQAIADRRLIAASTPPSLPQRRAVPARAPSTAAALAAERRDDR